jgi:hypothetical protein
VQIRSADRLPGGCGRVAAAGVQVLPALHSTHMKGWFATAVTVTAPNVRYNGLF